MAKRQVFFSFHYDNDNWRAGQVRNMGKVDSSSTFSDNDWEEVKEKTESNSENIWKRYRGRTQLRPSRKNFIRKTDRHFRLLNASLE